MSAAGRPHESPLGAAAGIALGVIATVLAYPPYSVPGLGWVMLAPVVAAIDGCRPRQAFARVFLYSVAMAVVLVRWLVYALVTQYRVGPAPAWLFLLLIICGLALVPSLAAALWARLAPRLSNTGSPFAFAALWTLGEWLRAEPLGFPWLLAAQSFSRVPIAIQTADLGGAYAVGFVAIAANAGLGLTLARRRWQPLAGPAALVALALGYGAWRMARLEPGPGAEVRAGVVQASVPQAQRFQPGSAARNVARHIGATRALLARQPLDLVVWSETAVDIDLDETPRLRDALAQLVTETGVPIATGAPRSAGGRRTNAVVLFAPGRGLVESYAKQRLVPYSEYDPKLGAWLAPLLGPVTDGDPYVAGDEATIFRDGPLPFAAPVCFEITYPHLVRRFRENGAALLVNLSNDAWFGPTGYPEMHFAHALFRAVENRTWILRGANTGISAAIDPAGRVVTELPVFEEGTVTAVVRAAGPAPLYARAGDTPVLLALVAVLTATAARPPPAGAAPAPGPRRSARSRPAARGRARR